MSRSLCVFVLLQLLIVTTCSAVNERHPTETDSSSQIESQSPFDNIHPDLLKNVTDWEIFPSLGLEQQFLNSTRRKLGSFQICALCTCCGERRRFCIPTACCYSITCGSPNRPFGFCSFMPMSCNCLGCRL